jgi:hypothetical protein
MNETLCTMTLKILLSRFTFILLLLLDLLLVLLLGCLFLEDVLSSYFFNMRR